MLEKILSFARLLWNQGEESKKQAAQIKDLQEENEKIRRMLQALAARDEQHTRELQHLRELVAKDMENLELRMKLDRLEAGKALPPRDQSR